MQAPAGIGKSSMLKYMCMKWGCNELWGSNFDVLIFVECRTLNRLGSMTGTQFMDKGRNSNPNILEHSIILNN